MTVVAYRTLGLGDLLAAVPALRGLRAAWPDDRLVVAAPAWLAPVARLTGAVDDVAHTPELGALDPDLHEAALVVNLHGRGPRSTAVLRASRPRRLIAFDAGSSAWKADEHEVDRWCRLLTESGIACDATDLDLPPPDRAAPPGAAGATVIHPGAKDPARRWPAQRFAAVARQVGDVVITGSAAERGLAQDVAARAGLDDRVVLAGRLDLTDLAAVVAGARAVVCGDTGVAHLATALRTPSVVLFGPVAPERWGPPGGRGEHLALWTGQPGDPHGREVDPGLLAIEVDDVLAALARLDAGR